MHNVSVIQPAADYREGSNDQRSKSAVDRTIPIQVHGIDEPRGSRSEYEQSEISLVSPPPTTKGDAGDGTQDGTDQESIV